MIRIGIQKGRITLARPRFVGWQHVVRTKQGAVRVTTRTHGRGERVAAVSDGPFAAAAWAAISSLRESAAVCRRPFVFAAVTVPQLMVQALWLRYARADRYWILGPSHPAAASGRLLTEHEFRRSLDAVFDRVRRDRRPSPSA